MVYFLFFNYMLLCLIFSFGSKGDFSCLFFVFFLDSPARFVY